MCATHRVCIDCDDDKICIMRAVSKSYPENVQINYTFSFLLFPHTVHVFVEYTMATAQ